MKKDWFQKELTVEIIVGAFIVMVFLGLAYFTIILSRDTWFSKKYTMEVCFKNVMGLRVEDNVVARGMPVGKVKKLDLDDSTCGVRVVLSLDKSLTMHKDYKIQVVATSILGGRQLEIYEGSENMPEVPMNAQFVGKDPYDIMADAAEIINSLRKGVVEGKMVDNLRDMSSDLRQITKRLNEGKGTLGKLLSEDEKMYNDLAQAVESLRNIVTKVERGEGALGKLVSDDTLYNQMDSLMEEVRNAVDDVRETAPLVTFTSIFFGAL